MNRKREETRDSKMNKEGRDREFQLQMLKVSLRHEREVGILTASMAVGASFVFFGITIMITIGQQWMLLGFLYSGMGLVLVCISLWYKRKIEDYEKKDIDSIRQQFIEKPRTTEG